MVPHNNHSEITKKLIKRYKIDQNLLIISNLQTQVFYNTT